MSDHLHGWKAIANHLGLGVSAVRHIHRIDRLPVYRLGRTIAGSRAAIDLWRRNHIAAAEAAALAPKLPTDG